MFFGIIKRLEKNIDIAVNNKKKKKKKIEKWQWAKKKKKNIAVLLSQFLCKF